MQIGRQKVLAVNFNVNAPLIAKALLVATTVTAAPAFLSAQGKGDPFAPYLTGSSPTVIRTVAERTIRNVRVKEIVFLSRKEPATSGGQRSEIYAIVASPIGGGRYPGLLLLHGGRGHAEVERAVSWAGKGYLVVAPDLPGIADPEKAPNSVGAWKTKMPKDYITAEPSVTSSPIFDAVLAGVQSLYLLRSQPNVVKEKTGVTGYAWGGYVATMVSGIARDDVAAVFSTFGAGFYDAGSFWAEQLDALPIRERDAWLRFLDAGRRAPLIRANYFLAASTNHPYFWVPSLQATVQAVRGPKNQVFAPNASTLIPLAGGTPTSDNPFSSWTEMEKSFFAFNLKGLGSPFPSVTIRKEIVFEEDVVRPRFEINGDASSVQAYYSLKNSPSTERVWRKAIISKIEKQVYEAIIPIGAAQEGADWFALASSRHPATVSSLIETVPPPLP